MLDVAFLLLNVTGMLIGYGHNFIEVMLPNGTIMIFRTPQALQVATQVPLGQNVSVMVNGTKLMIEYKHRYRHKYMFNATVTQVEEMIGNKTVCISCKQMKETYKHQYKHMYNETEEMTKTMTHRMEHKEMHKEEHKTMTSTVTETQTQTMKQERHGEEHKEEHAKG